MAERPRPAVRRLRPDERPAAAALLARGMRDNPVHVAALGDRPERGRRALEGLFGAVLAMDGREHLCAVDGGRIVGVVVVAGPGRCQPPARERVRAGAAIGPFGVVALARVLAWQRAWIAHDPQEAHAHLGPVAVAPDLRGRGIGSALLRACTGRLDAARQTGHLETDRAENVPFYRRHGLAVTGEATVLGGPHWFLRRPAARGSG